MTVWENSQQKQTPCKKKYPNSVRDPGYKICQGPRVGQGINSIYGQLAQKAGKNTKYTYGDKKPANNRDDSTA